MNNAPIKKNKDTTVSIIIPCKNEIENIENTLNSIGNSKTEYNIEIIVVNDSSTDGDYSFIDKLPYNINHIKTENAGVAGSRNLGALNSKGEYLFFVDAHITVEDYCFDILVDTLKKEGDLVAPVIADMNNPNAIGYGETWDENLNTVWLKKNPEEDVTEIPIAPGGFLGIKRRVFEDIGGFDNYFRVWGKEDEEISLKAWLFGYRVVINSTVTIKHLFRVVHPYEVRYNEVIFNFLVMATSHFNLMNLSKVIIIAQKHGIFHMAMAEVLMNPDIAKQRERYMKKRIHDDNYFFIKFNIPL